MNVVLTAPIPWIRTPSFPDGASIFTPFCITMPPLDGYISHKKAQSLIGGDRCAHLSPICAFLWLFSDRCGITARSPARLQIVAIHPRDDFKPDFLRAHCFAFPNIRAASEEFLFNLRHPAHYPRLPLGLPPTEE